MPNRAALPIKAGASPLPCATHRRILGQPWQPAAMQKQCFFPRKPLQVSIKTGRYRRSPGKNGSRTPGRLTCRARIG